MAVFRQKKVGFKPVPVSVQLGNKKMKSLKLIRAEQEAKRAKNRKSQRSALKQQGRKALTKTIDIAKANAMSQTLKQSQRVAFDVLLNEIKLNPSASLADVYVNVVRKLKSVNPQEQYFVNGIERLYKAGIKQGAIKTN